MGHLLVEGGQVIDAELVQMIVPAGAGHDLHQLGGGAEKVVELDGIRPDCPNQGSGTEKQPARLPRALVLRRSCPSPWLLRTVRHSSYPRRKADAPVM